MQNLLITLNLSDFHIIITDTETALINALSVVFSVFKNLLCLWHINKNILSYVKKKRHLSAQKKLNTESKEMTEIKKVITHWHSVLYTITIEDYHKVWAQFQSDYVLHSGLFYYFNNMWLRYDWKLILCYTNSIQHCSNTFII